MLHGPLKGELGDDKIVAIANNTKRCLDAQFEMAPSKQSGIFISHMTEENPVAMVLQKYFKLAFGSDLRTFVSSDKISIGGGKKWFNDIIENLRASKVVLVLVSQESIRRQWTNFEAGFGDGAECLIIPVAIKGFPLGQMSYPLQGYQGRNVDDFEGLLGDIEDFIGAPYAKIDPKEYLAEIREAEAKLFYKTIVIRPTWIGRQIGFTLENVGNVDIELLMFETLVPQEFIDRNWPAYEYDSKTVLRGDILYRWLACYSPRGTYRALKPTLRPFLTVSMGAVEIDSFTVPAALPIPRSHLELRLFFQLHAIGYSTQLEQQAIGDIPGIPGGRANSAQI